MLQFIPQNLDLDQVLLDHPPCFKCEKDYLIHILHLLTEIPANNKDLLENDYVPLYSVILQSRIRNYRECLNYLIERNIIQTDNHYIVNEVSRGYKFSPLYQTPCRETSIEKYTLIKGIREHQWHQNRPAEQKHHVLRQFFNEKLLIDHAGAIAFLQQSYQTNIENNVKNAIGKYNSGILQVARFRDQNFFFHVDGTVNRLHSNLTTCASGLRNFLTYEGHALVSVDLRNSQPYLSLQLFTPEFWADSLSTTNVSNPFTLFNISPQYYSKIVSTKSNNIMLVNTLFSKDSTGFADVKTFREKVLAGTLYEYIAEELTNRHVAVFKTRNQLKAMIFMVMFSDNRFIGQKDAEPKRIFRELFPNVYSVFKAIKRHGSNNLPIILQRMESRLMLDCVARRILKEKPGMPIYTIHDSIVCPEGQQGYVAHVIHDECSKHLRVQPNLHYEFWRPRTEVQVQQEEHTVHAA